METFIKTLERLEYIDRLIRLKATGTPNELSKKLRISQSHLYNLLNLLKMFGAPLYFDVSSNSYFYYENFILNVTFHNLLKLD